MEHPMHKRAATAEDLSSELDRLIRERARGPYARYFHAPVPQPVPLPQRDANGCNWTVVNTAVLPAAAVAFIDLIVSRLMHEYDLVPG
jgi:hypothetical protein